MGDGKPFSIRTFVIVNRRSASEGGAIQIGNPRIQKGGAGRWTTYILGSAMRDLRPRLATLISVSLNPAAVAAVALIATSDCSVWDGRRGFLIALGPGVPALLAVLLRATGRVPGLFIPRSRDRILPLVVASISCGVSGGLLLAAEGPTVPVVLLFSFSVLALTMAFVAVFWMASLHAAGAAASAAAVAHTFPGLGPVLLAGVCLIGWSRLETRAHTLPQVIAGIGFGGLLFLATSRFLTRIL